MEARSMTGSARRWLAIVLAALLVVGGPPAAVHAVTPQEVLPDPVLEKRARDISAELRCLVCQNQSIDDSDAPLAHDLRVLVRERLSAGDSDQQVRDFLVARYGEFVLLKPPFSVNTLLLWLMPLLGLAAAVLILWRAFSPARREATAAVARTAKLSLEEQAALDDLLKRERGGDRN